MTPRVRHELALHIGIAVALCGHIADTAAQGAAASYPIRPLRMVIALAPGGGVDTTGRLMGQKLSELWGQQVVAENRPGAGGTIAADLVAKAPADGYTLLMTSVGHAISPVFYKQLPYDVHKSFAAIARFVVAPNVIVVHPSVPVKTIRELVAFAKARPGELLFSTSGMGGPQHLTLELFNSLAGTKIVHVPYKGTGPSMLDLIGGRVSVSAASLTSAMPHARSGKLKALAVTGGQRSIAEPDLPTVAEAGVPGFANDIWYGAFGPAGLPREIVAKLSAESVKILQAKEVREKLIATGLEPAPLASEEFAAFFRDEVAKIAKIARTAGIKAE
jgi:tripartite-type tricarboxylate transporter receptor subunit TctC